MRIRNRWLSLAWKLGILIPGTIGLLWQTGLRRGGMDWTSLTMYTNLSNLICWAYFLADAMYTAVWGGRGRTTLFPRGKGGLVMGIALTMAVYHFLLGGWRWDRANIIVHYYVPTATILDWLLFDRKGVFRPWDPLLWTLLPLGYLGYTLAMGLSGRRVFYGRSYPYPFLNVNALGGAAVARNCLLVAAFYLAACFLLLGLDAALARLGKRGKAADGALE